MRIVFLTMNMQKGGAERVISILANKFIQDNEVSIITMMKTPIAYTLSQKIKLINIDRRDTSTSVIRRKIKKISPIRMVKLKKIILEQKPDLVICFLPEPSLRFMLLKRTNRKIGKIPTIISIRNDPKVEFKNPIINAIMQKLYPLADGFVFQTQEAKEFFKTILADRVPQEVIMNPVSSEFMIGKPYSGKREKVIVSVGRLELQKNHELLIDAFGDLHKKLKDYKLIIYGEGPLRKKLEEKIRQLGLEDYVKLPGQIDNVETKIYRASCFVLSSNYEGMPNALMEAMALGIPCVSTDCPCGGPRALIKHADNGYLVPMENKEKLAETVGNILENDKMARRVANNSVRVSLQCEEPIVIRRWMQLINRIR